MNLKLTYDNVVTFVKDWFGLIGVIIGVVSYLGFSISAPWATAGDLETVQQQMLDLKRDVRDMSCLALRVLLHEYQRQRDDAEDELRLNPASTSARRAKIEAENQIASITAQMRDSKCK